MSQETTPRRERSQRPLSVIVGLILVPISAIAAIALVDPKPSPEQPPTPDAVIEMPAAAATSATVDLGGATADDLARACGPAGLQLVAAEEAGDITDVQQAGLDALREICAAEGMSLPGKPLPEPVVETVVVRADPAPAGPTATIGDEDESDDEFEEEDEEDEQDEEDEDGGEDESEEEGD